MYAYTRTCSIFRNAQEKGLALGGDVNWQLLGAPEERAVALRLASYPATLAAAATSLDPSLLAEYLLNLAREFSRFWKQHSVLNADDPALRQARLTLCARVHAVLGDGLRALAIPTLEAM
jgi:arginyl-tRNA synthetase